MDNSTRKMRIDVNQATVDQTGGVFKRLVVKLRDGQTIDAAVKTPEAWLGIQRDAMKMLGKFDTVCIISPDGLTMARDVPVKKALGGHVWFGKTPGIETAESDALYTNDTHEVVAHGTGYAIKTLRDGNINYDRVFPTAKAAEHEIERCKPVKAA